jgi:hypothetical protein
VQQPCSVVVVELEERERKEKSAERLNSIEVLLT